MPHTIEEIGIELLTTLLVAQGHSVHRRHGTFDLEVDGKPAEVKTKNKRFDQLDFISLTEKQQKAAQERDFDIYIVCNLHSGTPEYYKCSARDLLSKTPRVVVSYEYDKRILKDVIKELPGMPAEGTKSIPAKASSSES